MGAHAVYAPSSAEQWGHCSGQPQAAAENPKPETPQSREGTAAHWVGSETLESGGRDCGVYLGTKAPNGIIIDDKMVDGAQVYVDDVLSVCDMYDARSLLLIEKRVDMPAIDRQGGNWGTFDASLYLPGLNLLFLWDYKHGFSEVSARGNFQLADYAEGLVECYRIIEPTMLDARVVQPFAFSPGGPVSQWFTPLVDLEPIWDRLASQIVESRTNPTLTTGYHCRYCPALGKCSASRGAQYNFIELVRQPYSMDTMTGHDLAVELNILDGGVSVAKKRADAIRDELMHRIQKGDGSTGLVLEATQGREVWDVPHEQVVAVGQQFGVDATKPALKTPAQLVAATPAGLRPAMSEVLKNFKRRNSGSLKLTRAADSKFAAAFQKVKEV
jgi:hypothetical protein